MHQGKDNRGSWRCFGHDDSELQKEQFILVSAVKAAFSAMHGVFFSIILMPRGK
jgi:endonuclease V-like protein UPF0215 family